MLLRTCLCSLALFSVASAALAQSEPEGWEEEDEEEDDAPSAADVAIDLAPDTLDTAADVFHKTNAPHGEPIPRDPIFSGARGMEQGAEEAALVGKGAADDLIHGTMHGDDAVKAVGHFGDDAARGARGIGTFSDDILRLLRRGGRGIVLAILAAFGGLFSFLKKKKS